jgi:hypothetical protein
MPPKGRRAAAKAVAPQPSPPPAAAAARTKRKTKKAAASEQQAAAVQAPVVEAPVDNQLLMLQMLQSLKEDNLDIKARMASLEEQTSPPPSTKPARRGKRQAEPPMLATDSTWEEQPSDQLRSTVNNRVSSLANPTAAHLLEAQAVYEEEEEETDQGLPWAPRLPCAAPPNKKGKVSGRLLTAASNVKYTLTWPHQRAFGLKGEMLKSEQLTIDQFTLGYLKVASEAPPAAQPTLYLHLREYMEDVAPYGFDTVRAFHSVWTNHVETGQVAWDDATARERLRRQFVWNTPLVHTRQQYNSTAAASTPDSTAQGRQSKAPFVPANTDSRPCKYYNDGNCNRPTSHPRADHICSYCFQTEARLCSHTEKHCGKKRRLMQAKN